ncbi:hypothetical protein LguiB_005736 [Lonicera macranthoides]
MVGRRKNTDIKANTSQVYFSEWMYNRLNRGKELHIRIEEDGDAIISIPAVQLTCTMK